MQCCVAWQIGGVRAPSPVGELGNVEMTQALTLADTRWEVIGSDLCLQGMVPQHMCMWACQAYSCSTSA